MNDTIFSSDNNVKELENNKMYYMKHTISKLKDGRWRTRITIDGHQVALYGRTQQEVCEKLKDMTKTNKPKTSKYTLHTWYLKWLELYKINNVRQSTLRSYNSVYVNHVKSIADKNIRLYKSIELIEHINKIKMERQRAKTYDLLKDLFDKAYKNKLISSNPLSAYRKPKITTREVLPLRKKEQEQFINACEQSTYKDYFLLALYTGMRKSELMAITIDDVDFDSKYIRVNKIVNTSNKVVETTKTKTSKRLIPLFNKCEEILSKYKNLEKGERLFKLSQAQTTRKFNEILKIANLSNFTIHSLRHTFATNCYELGIPSKQVQAWLGHSDSKITESIYIGLTKEYENMNISKINKGI